VKLSQVVRLRDIAEQAGVSSATVSLAMRNHPSISSGTRRRIQTLAERLGYRPHPLVSILMRQVRNSRPSSALLTLAMVIPFSSKGSWRNYLSYDLITAATTCAERQGYRLEQFWMNDLNITGRRLGEVLYHRGITGVIISPLPVAHGHLNFDWSRFSTVAIGHSLAKPDLNRVSSHRFQAMRMAVSRLRSVGYERLGLAIDANQDSRVDHEWTAAFEWEQRHTIAKQRAFVLLADQARWGEAIFSRWFKAVRPQVVLGYDPSIISWLKNLGRRVPEDVGFVHLWAPDQMRQYAGIYHNPPALGMAAVNLLIGMIQRNETGLPETPQTVLLNASWVEGDTLMPLKGMGGASSTGARQAAKV
jgi:LacI family transcriptional regulator